MKIGWQVSARRYARDAASSEAPMRVCAACGARDPFDLCQKSVPLLELPDAHWLRADGGAGRTPRLDPGNGGARD